MYNQINGKFKGTDANEVLKMQKQGEKQDRTLLGTYEYHGHSRKRDAEHNVAMREGECARTKLSHEDNTTSLTSNEESEIKKAVISTVSSSSKPASIIAKSIFSWSTRPMRIRIYTHHLPDFCRASLNPVSLSEWLLSKTEEYIAATGANVQAYPSGDDARSEADKFLSWLDATSKAAHISALTSAPATATHPEAVDITKPASDACQDCLKRGQQALKLDSANAAASMYSSEEMGNEAQQFKKVKQVMPVGAGSSAANKNALLSGPRVRPLFVCACACACGGRPQTAGVAKHVHARGARSPSAGVS